MKNIRYWIINGLFIGCLLAALNGQNQAFENIAIGICILYLIMSIVLFIPVLMITGNEQSIRLARDNKALMRIAKRGRSMPLMVDLTIDFICAILFFALGSFVLGTLFVISSVLVGSAFERLKMLEAEQ